MRGFVKHRFLLGFLPGLMLALLLAAVMILTGCKQEEVIPPHHTADALCQLLYKDNALPMKDLFGYASEEEVREEISSMVNLYEDEEYIEEFKEGMAAMGLEIDSETAIAWAKASAEAVSKLEFSAKLVSEEGSKAVVAVEMGYYSPEEMIEITERAAEEALKELGAEAIEDEEANAYFAKLYFEKCIEAIRTLTPAEGTKEVTTEFEKIRMEINGKTRTVWFPKDRSQFGREIGTAAMGGM